MPRVAYGDPSPVVARSGIGRHGDPYPYRLLLLFLHIERRRGHENVRPPADPFGEVTSGRSCFHILDSTPFDGYLLTLALQRAGFHLHTLDIALQRDDHQLKRFHFVPGRFQADARSDRPARVVVGAGDFPHGTRDHHVKSLSIRDFPR